MKKNDKAINKKILITGGSGFIGTNLLIYFKRKGYDVLNFDIQEPRNSGDNALWKNIDITNCDELKNAIVEFSPNYILHFAARTDLKGESLSDYAANVEGVENIMKVVQYLPELKKIIVASSMLVCKSGYIPKNQIDYKPVNFYGLSKVETEKIVWKNKPSCDWAIVRPTSIWGPYFSIPYKDFFERVMTRRYFHIGNKSCTKTYGYIENTIYQIEKILFTDTFDDKNKVFYLGDKPGVNIEEWANEIAAEAGVKIIRMPYFLLKLSAIVGDVLSFFKIDFPMTSFRLKNMTTNNVVNLENTFKIAAKPPFSRIEGVQTTVKWLNSLKLKP